MLSYNCTFYKALCKLLSLKIYTVFFLLLNVKFAELFTFYVNT